MKSGGKSIRTLSKVKGYLILLFKSIAETSAYRREVYTLITTLSVGLTIFLFFSLMNTYSQTQLSTETRTE